MLPVPDWLSEHWLKAATAGVTLLGTISVGGYNAVQWHNAIFADREYVDERFDELGQLIAMNDMRMGQKIQSDKVDQLQERLWRLEDRYGKDIERNPEVPESVREEYRQLQMQRERALNKLESIEQRLDDAQPQLSH